MKLYPGAVVVLYDDPKFFYIVRKHYRYKEKYRDKHTVTLHGNFYTFDGLGDPEPNILAFEYLAWASASKEVFWTSFDKRFARLATEEEMRLIMLLLTDEELEQS